MDVDNPNGGVLPRPRRGPLVEIERQVGQRGDGGRIKDVQKENRGGDQKAGDRAGQKAQAPTALAGACSPRRGRILQNGDAPSPGRRSLAAEPLVPPAVACSSPSGFRTGVIGAWKLWQPTQSPLAAGSDGSRGLP